MESIGVMNINEGHLLPSVLVGWGSKFLFDFEAINGFDMSLP
jgi:hypothetical protein